MSMIVPMVHSPEIYKKIHRSLSLSLEEKVTSLHTGMCPQL